MYPFLLFCCTRYYPSGGWEDYVDSFSCVESAKIAGAEHISDDGYGSFHIVDLATKKIVYNSTED